MSDTIRLNIGSDWGEVLPHNLFRNVAVLVANQLIQINWKHDSARHGETIHRHRAGRSWRRRRSYRGRIRQRKSLTDDTVNRIDEVAKEQLLHDPFGKQNQRKHTPTHFIFPLLNWTYTALIPDYSLLNGDLLPLAHSFFHSFSSFAVKLKSRISVSCTRTDG